MKFKLPETDRLDMVDPPLDLLVRRLAPIFVKVTGRSLHRVLFNRDGDRRDYFAEWIYHLIWAATKVKDDNGNWVGTEISLGTVDDIVVKRGLSKSENTVAT